MLFVRENYVDGESLSTLTAVEFSQLVPEIGLKKNYRSWLVHQCLRNGVL